MHIEMRFIYEAYDTTKELQDALAHNALKSDVTARKMERKFNHIKCLQDVLSFDDIRKMKNMLSELWSVWCILTENQKMIALFESLIDDSLFNLKMILIHSGKIKTFDNYANHLVHQVKMTSKST